MNRTYNNIRYTTLVASDAHRDGISLELHWHSQNQDNVVAEIFMSNNNRSWALNTFDCDVPLELIGELIAEAKMRLAP